MKSGPLSHRAPSRDRRPYAGLWTQIENFDAKESGPLSQTIYERVAELDRRTGNEEIGLAGRTTSRAMRVRTPPRSSPFENMSKYKLKNDSWPWCEPCNSYHAPGNPTCRKVMDTKIPAEFTVQGQYEIWRKQALKNSEIPPGSMQDNEMRKAFFSGMGAAAATIYEASATLPETIAASLPFRWAEECQKFFERQVILQPVSKQNERGN